MRTRKDIPSLPEVITGGGKEAKRKGSPAVPVCWALSVPLAFQMSRNPISPESFTLIWFFIRWILFHLKCRFYYSVVAFPYSSLCFLLFLILSLSSLPLTLPSFPTPLLGLQKVDSVEWVTSVLITFIGPRKFPYIGCALSLDTATLQAILFSVLCISSICINYCKTHTILLCACVRAYSSQSAFFFAFFALFFCLLYFF